MSLPRARTWLVATAAVAIAAAAAGVTARPKPPPQPVEIIPPPMPPMPPVSMSQHLVEDAAAYADYMRQAALISPAFTDAAGVQQSLRAGASYQPGQFVRGEMAYAAIAALQDKTFVAAVRSAGQTPNDRYTLVRGVFADPSYALAFDGAANAAGLAKEALTSDGMRLFGNGKTVANAAYSIQHQPWSLANVPDPVGRLAGVKTASTSLRTPPPDETATLQSASRGEPALSLTPDPGKPPYTPLVVRAVALAALAAIGEAGDDHLTNISWLTDDYFTGHCLAHAKIELNNCLAVARPNYEDVFCLGQQAMNATGACVVQGAGGAVPFEMATQPLSIPPYRHHPPAHTRRRHS